MKKYIKISEENKTKIEKNYRKFYEDSRENNKKIKYSDLERLLPSSLVKREWECLQQENRSYYLDLLLPVQRRSGNRCELSGWKCENLQVHHLDSYQFDRNGRMDPQNTIALAPEVHRKFHELYGYKRNNRDQFKFFARDFKKGKITIYKDL